MNHFILRRLINKGGMGSVFEADSVQSNGAAYPVAIKVMNGNPRSRERYTELFQRESLTNLRIGHNHRALVTVFGQFEHADGSQCMVMELVQGCDLRALLKAHKTLPIQVIWYIAAQMLDGLKYIHKHGYLHRDLSPSNVLLSLAGDVKVSDLGLAKELQNGYAKTNRFWGKPEYSSPEALNEDILDPRSDLYSFAAVVYEMATGKQPFGSKLDVAKRLENWLLPSMSGVPAELLPLIDGLFCTDPDQRVHQNARDALKIPRGLGFTADDDDEVNVAARRMLAELVEPVYRRQRAKSEPQTRIPLGSLAGPVMLQTRAIPSDRTVVPDGDDTRSGTKDSEPMLDPDEISFSGLDLNWPPRLSGRRVMRPVARA